MNKPVVLLCKNFKCNNNDNGDCKRSQVSQRSDGSLTPDRLICEDFEPIPNEDEE